VIDLLFGSFLLLVWLGILPLDIQVFGLSRSWIGALGALLALSGVVVIAFLSSRIREP